METDDFLDDDEEREEEDFDDPQSLVEDRDDDDEEEELQELQEKGKLYGCGQMLRLELHAQIQLLFSLNPFLL